MGSETEKLWKSEDYWAIWFAVALFLGIICGVISFVPKVSGWTTNPFDAFPDGLGPSIAILGAGLGVLMTIGVRIMQGDWKKFFLGYLAVFALAVLSYTIAGQAGVKSVDIDVIVGDIAGHDRAQIEMDIGQAFDQAADMV